MKTIFLFISLFACKFSFSQELKENLAKAIAVLKADEQFSHSILSMSVVNGKTGNIIYEENPQVGVAPASCQKIITSTTAFEFLGKQYSYKTEIAYDGVISNNTLVGNLYIIGSGDPTLGSWRWQETTEKSFGKKILSALQDKNISKINGDIIIDTRKWESQVTPRGWIWEDIGNYYGAGASALSWHEDQYDLILKPGKNAGDPVAIAGTDPVVKGVRFVNELKTGKEGSGDNSVIYLPETGSIAYVRGTVPAGKETFKVAGAVPDAPQYFAGVLLKIIAENNISLVGKIKTSSDFSMNKLQLNYKPILLQSIISPPLDSINYWFLKKSINLYGEALVKTIAYEKIKTGVADSGIALIKDFWSKRGIDKGALKIIDGSGLSPANRITSNALVTVLQYARQQSWFPSFYYALPEINGIKMKDGYINGVRSYAGFVKSHNGIEYTFAFIVNNFDGSPGTVREKMWKILDLLK